VKKILLLITLFIFSLSNIKAQTIRDSLVSNGVMRYYNLYLSKNYTAGMPLIIALHPYTLGAAEMAEIANFSPVADTGNFLVVYPEGLIDNSHYPYWNVGWPGQPASNDLLFISDLIDSLHNRNNIDLNKVYACGISNGAVMSYELATRLGKKIAAIASASGSMPPNVFDTTVAKRVVPVLEIHGTADGTFPWAGCGNCEFPSVPVDTLRKFWLNADSTTTEDSVAIPDINTSDGSTVEQYIYSGGPNGAMVELFKVINGQHPDWPGSTFGSGNNEDFNASATMWNFFKQYTLDEFPLGIQPVKNIQSVNFYPDPATHYVQCSLSQLWRNSPIHLEIMNAMGQMVKNYTVRSSATLQLDIGDLAEGFYMVQLNNGKMRLVGKLIKD
jgi:polyhydroxybutyrate depolymerase